MIHRLSLGCFLVLALVALGCSDDSGSGGTAGSGGTGAGGGAGGTAGSGGTFEPPAFGEWVKYEPEGTVCSDGSQYAFYVEFSETSDNIAIYFMGGGGCWDYDSCISGNARGATNPNGLPDDYANEHVFFPLGDSELAVNVNQVYPLINDDPSVTPMADWNKVFVPYCTGDVYAGSVTNTYQDPNGVEPDAEFAHQGHTNVLAMTEMLNEMFDTVPKMFVGGCSAGGAGAIVNYYFLRTGIEGVERGYLLDDSGPLFPNQAPTSRSLPLHNEVRSVWDADSLIASAPQTDVLSANFGELSRVLSEEFPDDRLASTFFRLDYNYSLYSYERFWTLDDGGQLILFDGEGLGLDQDVSTDRTGIHTAWWDDIELLRAQYDAPGRDNLGYYIPFYRNTNDSHCVSIPGFDDAEGDLVNLFLTDFASLAWAGSEIQSEDMNLRDYVDHLLSDEPLESYFEEEGEGPFVPCTPNPDDFDADACEAVVNPPED
ncbi:MAG: pectin acetylesterase-family hydrolase [Polyangiales bacterium]